MTMVWMDAWPGHGYLRVSQASLRQSPRPELHARSSHSPPPLLLFSHTSTIATAYEYMLHCSQSRKNSYCSLTLKNSWIQVCPYHYYVLLIYTIICLSLPHGCQQSSAVILHCDLFSRIFLVEPHCRYKTKLSAKCYSSGGLQHLEQV